MLTIVLAGGIYRPIVACDWCLTQINRGSEGNYEWLAEVPTGKTLDAAIRSAFGMLPATAIAFTHKRCCRAFEAANPEPENAIRCAEDLDRLPLFLATNLQIDVGAVREKVRLWEM